MPRVCSSLLALCAAAGAASAAAAQDPAQDPHRFTGSKPNVILLFADDFGWGDVGHNAPGVVWETPAIDALAHFGATFKDMHTFPLCTPSRGQMLTGRHPIRTGVTTNFAEESLAGLPTTEYTIAELLKPANYDTIQLGKWASLGAAAAARLRHAAAHRVCPRTETVPFLVPSAAPWHASAPPPELARL